jgi:hypothetical protein
VETSLNYKKHAIIAGAKRDERTGKYKPLVHIAWHAPTGRRQNHSFALQHTCETFEEASAHALSAAKGWVDRHVMHLGA